MGIRDNCGPTTTRLARPAANEQFRLASCLSACCCNGDHQSVDCRRLIEVTAYTGYTTSMNLLTSPAAVLMSSRAEERASHGSGQNSLIGGTVATVALATNNNCMLATEPTSLPFAIGYRSVSAMPSPLQTYLSYFYTRRVETRRTAINKTLREVVQIAQELLHEVELQEPRFINTLKLVHPKNQQQQQQQQPMGDYSGKVIYSEKNASQQSVGYYDGFRVLSPTRFEVILFLNQMGVFNFVDDGSVPGGAVLKLSDGRKRSMSLWVEFITASGYLSARKIRARFHSLVGQAVQKCSYRGIIRMVGQTSEVMICIRERYILQITPAFRCSGLWPRSACHWPLTTQSQPGAMLPTRGHWPTNQLANEVKMEGFCLLSQESVYTKDKQASAEGDAWLLDFYDAEERLLVGSARRQCFSILKTLADQHLAGLASTNNLSGDAESNAGQLEPTIQAYDLKTLVLHECEKHPRDEEWVLEALLDRINGVLLQLISCLQHRRCPHYFMPHLDVFRSNSVIGMDVTARQAWCLLRELITCPRAFEQL